MPQGHSDSSISLPSNITSADSIHQKNYVRNWQADPPAGDAATKQLTIVCKADLPVQHGIYGAGIKATSTDPASEKSPSTQGSRPSQHTASCVSAVAAAGSPKESRLAPAPAAAAAAPDSWLLRARTRVAEVAAEVAAGRRRAGGGGPGGDAGVRRPAAARESPAVGDSTTDSAAAATAAAAAN